MFTKRMAVCVNRAGEEAKNCAASDLLAVLIPTHRRVALPWAQVVRLARGQSGEGVMVPAWSRVRGAMDWIRSVVEDQGKWASSWLVLKLETQTWVELVVLAVGGVRVG